MTNEDKAKILAGYSVDTAYLDMSIEARRKYADLILMAQWKDQQYSQDEAYNRGIHDVCQQFKEYLEKKYDTALNAWDDWAAYDPKTAESWRVKTQYIREIINELFPATEQNKED